MTDKEYIRSTRTDDALLSGHSGSSRSDQGAIRSRPGGAAIGFR